MWIAIDNGNVGTESPEHLAKLAADVSTSQDQEVSRQRAKLHQSGVVQPPDALQSGQGWNDWAGTHIDDHCFRRVALARDIHFSFADKARVPLEKREAIPRRVESLPNLFPPPLDDRILAIDHCSKIDPHRPGVDS